jgi:hypothetical protein
MGYAAAADREGVVDGSLDDLSIARTQCYSPLERERERVTWKKRTDSVNALSEKWGLATTAQSQRFGVY